MSRTPRKGSSMSGLSQHTTPRTTRPPPAPSPMKTRTSAPSPVKATPRAKEKKTQGEEGIRVAIRMRPLNTKEERGKCVWKVLPKYSSVTQTTADEKPLAGAERVTGRTFFTFDQTFGGDASTAQVYHAVAKDIVQSTISGLNGTIFAYGQTSSGKTFTMQGSGTIAEGSVSEKGGIVHLAAADIFEHIRNTPDRVFLVRASFLEIYNEEVRDLLSPDTKTLQIREDPRRGVFVQSEEEFVTDFDSLLALLFKGEKSRQFASTAMNERSSRSHTIFRITIESRAKAENGAAEEDNTIESGDGAVLISTLNLVDLAGSESVRYTGATGKRQKEGGMINQSLLALSQVIVALGDPNQAHINFRDSKLTRILQPSLSGNARMSIVCCATPSDLYLEETRSTLQFASRAKLVKTRAQVNEVLDDRSLIRRLQKELAEARRNNGGGEPVSTDHVRALKAQAESAGSVVKQYEEKLRRLKSSILNNNVFFADGSKDRDSAEPLEEPRKRRLSEGDLLLSRQPNANIATPKTMPRPIKKNKQTGEILSKSAELALLQEALSVKSGVVADLKTRVEEISHHLQKQESELLESRSSNDVLRMDKETAQAETDRLLASIESIRLELAETIAAHEAAMSEKQVAMEELITKLQDQCTALDALQEEATALEVKNVALEEELQRVTSASKESTDRLVSEKEQLANEMETLKQELQAESSKLDASEEQCSTLQTRIAQVESERDDLTTELAESKKETSGLETILQDKDAELTRLAAELDESSRRLEACQGELVEANKEIKLYQSTATAHEESLESQKAHLIELQQERDEKDNIVAQLEESVACLEKQVHDADSAIESLTLSLQESQEQVASQSNTIEGLETSLAESKLVEDERDNLLNKLAESKEKVVEFESNLQDTDERLAVAAKERDETIVQLESTQATLETAQEELEALRSELEGSRKQNTSHESEIETLRSERDALSTKLAETEKSLETMKETLKEAETNIGLLKSSLQESEENVSLQASTIERLEVSLQARVEDLQSQLAEAQLDHDAITQKLAAKENEYLAANDQISQLNSSVETLKNAIDSSSEESQVALQAAISARNDLEALVGMHLSTLEETRNEVARLQDDLTSAKKMIATCTINAASSQEIIDTLSVEKLELSQQLDAINEELSETESGRKQALNELEQVKQEQCAIQLKYDELVDAYQVLQSENAASHSSLEEQSEELSRTLLSLAEAVKEKQQLELDLVKHLDELQTLESEKSDAVRESDELKEDIARREKEMSDAESEIKENQAIFADLKTCLAEKEKIAKELSDEISTLKTMHQAARDQLMERADDLINTHEMLESTTSQLQEAKQRLSDLDDELICKTTMLSQENDSLMVQLKDKEDMIAQLESSVTSLTREAREAGAIAARLPDLEGSYEQLVAENVDLKKLLVSSNASIDNLQKDIDSKRSELANAASLLAEQEEEIRHLQSSTSQTACKISLDSAALDKANKKISELSNELESEKADRLSVESKLIQEAEESTKALRQRVFDLEEEIKALNAQGYAARETIEELRDREQVLQKKLEELKTMNAEGTDKVIQSESTLAALRNENERIKKSLEMAQRSSDSKQQAEVKKLNTDLQQADRQLKEQEHEITRLTSENDRLTRDLVSMKSLQSENSRFIQDVTDLQTKLRSLARDRGDQESKFESLSAESTKLKHTIAEKDERIRKLEGNKMTRAQLDSIKQIQVDNKTYKQRLAEVENELAQSQKELSELRQHLASSISTEEDADQIQRLLFDQKGMQSKLTKMSRTNRALEEELVGIRTGLERRCGDMIKDGDISKAVASLCDRLASLEQVQSDAKVSATEISQMNRQIDSLQSEKVALERKIDEMTAQINQEPDQTSSIVHDDLVRQIQALQKDNLQLHNQIKQYKSDLRSARAELTMSRVKGTDDTQSLDEAIKQAKNRRQERPRTQDFDTIGNVGSTPKASIMRKEDAMSTNKENGSSAKYQRGGSHHKTPLTSRSANKVRSSNLSLRDSTQKVSTTTTQRVPGLGQPGVQTLDHDDQQQCNQQ